MGGRFNGGQHSKALEPDNQSLNRSIPVILNLKAVIQYKCCLQ